MLTLAPIAILFALVGVSAQFDGKQYVLPEKRCPPGFRQTADACVKATYVEPLKKCPKEAKLEGNTCALHKHAEPEFVCQWGEVLKGKKCELVETVKASVYCEHGYSLVGEQCTKQVHDKHKEKCPSGFKAQSDGECVRQNKSPANLVCPHPYVALNDKHLSCVLESFAAPSVSCPKHYQVEGTQCVKVDSVPPHSHCPKGFEKDHGGAGCVRTTHVPRIEFCPHGSEMKGNHCVVLKTTQPENTCHKGFDLHGNVCLKTVEEAPVTKCPKEYKLHNDVCVEHHYAKASPVCPPGTTMTGHKCVVIDVAPYVTSCPNHFSETADGQCVKVQTHRVERKCPHGFQWDGQVCVGTQSAKAIASCPEGVLKHDKCFVEKRVNPDKVCKKGTLMQGDCIDSSTKPLSSKCPKDSKESDGKCVRVAHTEALLECPHKSVLVGHKCETSLSSPPAVFCPKHFFMDGLSSPVCKKTHSEQPSYACHSDYIYKGGVCIAANLKGAHH